MFNEMHAKWDEERHRAEEAERELAEVKATLQSHNERCCVQLVHLVWPSHLLFLLSHLSLLFLGHLNMRENRGNAVVLPVLFAGYLRKKHPAKIPLPCVPGKNTRWRYICRVSQAMVPSEEGLT
ncbi:hypothetical protein QYE76_008864 [Lolium multiflorum]|uniref:Uncharacterized protein n=1 Tax=Lolium multiflorum TaxID=4521 RepID=A0AAD8TSI3_LOLMU|nr:hypothetical protein QYE76_008864 [Lolium multiflorum]